MSGAKSKKVYLIAFMVLLAGGFVYKYAVKNYHSGITVFSGDSSSSSVIATDTTVESSMVTEETIQVYICGEVLHPGIFEVNKGTILNDIVQSAGGFTSEAAVDYLNLVYKFDNNMSVYIPSEDDLDKGDSVIMRNSNSLSGNNSSNGTLVNINIADQTQLMTLPGIGEGLANLIIAYRTEHKFNKVDDIMNVSGIGETKFQRIKALITV